MVRTHILATVSAKRLLNAKVDLPFDDYYAYFLHLCFSAFPKCVLGWNPLLDPLLLVQIFALTHYLPHTSSYVLGNCPCSRHPDRSTTYRFRVMAVRNPTPGFLVEVVAICEVSSCCVS